MSAEFALGGLEWEKGSLGEMGGGVQAKISGRFGHWSLEREKFGYAVQVDLDIFPWKGQLMAFHHP